MDGGDNDLAAAGSDASAWNDDREIVVGWGDHQKPGFRTRLVPVRHVVELQTEIGVVAGIEGNRRLGRLTDDDVTPAAADMGGNRAEVAVEQFHTRITLQHARMSGDVVDTINDADVAEGRAA